MRLEFTGAAYANLTRPSRAMLEGQYLAIGSIGSVAAQRIAGTCKLTSADAG